MHSCPKGVLLTRPRAHEWCAIRHSCKDSVGVEHAVVHCLLSGTVNTNTSVGWVADIIFNPNYLYTLRRSASSTLSSVIGDLYDKMCQAFQL